MKVWSRLASAKWADAWEERLRGLAGERLAIHYLPSGRSIRLEVYEPNASEQKVLTDEFGGQLRSVKKDSWLAPGVVALKPIFIRNRLIVVHNEIELRRQQKSHPERDVLLVPSSAAFGTGDHATTATCLRLLTDEATRLAGDNWQCIDVGTGTGILAIAASLLGAQLVRAIDHDRRAIDTARANADVNGVGNIRFSCVKLSEWQPAAQSAIVMANVFSEAIIEAAGQLIAALQPGGLLIVSGILNHQADETLAALRAAGNLGEPVIHRRGKWTTASIRQLAK